MKAAGQLRPNIAFYPRGAGAVAVLDTVRSACARVARWEHERARSSDAPKNTAHFPIECGSTRLEVTVGARLRAS
jgi:hypothetical protein